MSESSSIIQLQERLADWRYRLSGDDVHAISPQIGMMLWRSAFYRSVNESRRFIPDGKDGEKLANGSLHELMHDGYVTIHALCVRRMLDNGRGVNSLLNLIRDIKKSSSLLTRGNMLAARDLEYDYEPIKTCMREEAWREAQTKGQKAYSVSGKGWAESECWHMLCDELCEVAEDARSSLDRPETRRFQELLNGLTGVGRSVETYVNNYIAHASPEHRRMSLPKEEHVLTLAKLWRAERVIVRVASFISRCVVEGVSIGGVPIPQFDQFGHMDRPFAVNSAWPMMTREWEAHADEIDDCRNWSWIDPVTTSSDSWPDDEAK